jgi:hypothetical protein
MYRSLSQIFVASYALLEFKKSPMPIQALKTGLKFLHDYAVTPGILNPFKMYSECPEL